MKIIHDSAEFADEICREFCLEAEESHLGAKDDDHDALVKR